jgi:hypothetical protein
MRWASITAPAGVRPRGHVMGGARIAAAATTRGRVR